MKVIDMIGLARQTALYSGAAAKLYGICNFLETGMFATIGQAFLAAIKDRQYDHKTDITAAIVVRST